MQVTVNNKQVIAGFVLGIALLLVAFWAGLNVVKQDTIPRVAAPNRASAGRPEPRTRSDVESPNNGDDPQNGTRYVLQVGSFGTPEKAGQLVNELRHKYKSAHTQNPAGDDTIYKVLIGPYDTRREVDQIADELAAQGMKGVMIVPWSQR